MRAGPGNRSVTCVPSQISASKKSLQLYPLHEKMLATQQVVFRPGTKKRHSRAQYVPLQLTLTDLTPGFTAKPWRESSRCACHSQLPTA